MSEPLRALWPEPRRTLQTGGELALPRRFDVDCGGNRELLGIALPACRRMAELGFDARATAASKGCAGVRVRRHAGRPRDAYSLAIVPDGIEIEASDRHGAWNALATLAQLATLCDRSGPAIVLPCVVIEDAPDAALRGALLDISRTRVPRQSTLYALVDELAALKVNQLQLYTEHTFAYPGHEDAWRGASPLTGSDVLELDRYCAERCVELVPNQQSFGHLHRWLVHARYRDLAEVPEGVEHAFSRSKEPYGLCATDPRALRFLAELYDALLPHFAAREINVGLDETFDLGLGRSKAACAARGKGRVYVDFLRAVHALLAERGRSMQFWGDIVLQHAELLDDVPRDALALEWGYDAGHPFDADARKFAASGLAFALCPGTSSWQSFAGRSANMLVNVGEAARAARRHGARGVLVTDWGDRGHLQPHPVKLAGLASAAGLAWNSASPLDAARLAEVLDLFVFRDRARVLGRAALELGRANEVSRAESTNGSPLFFLVAFAEGAFPHPRVQALTRAGLGDAAEHVRAVASHLARARPARPDAHALVDEWRFAADALLFACDLGAERLDAGDGVPLAALNGRTRLANDLGALAREHRRLWLERDRPGGLDESASWLERPLALLRGESVAAL